MASDKPDPFLEALVEEAAAHPHNRTRPVARNSLLKAASARPAKLKAAPQGWRARWRRLPVPIQAGVLFAALIGLAMVLMPLVGRLIVGRQGLDNVIAFFALESGVGMPTMVGIVPFMAGIYACVVYLGALRRVTRMGQSMSRALLVVLLTWTSFSAWAMKLWCLPQDYGVCYSRMLTVSCLLGGGPVLLAGLIAGYIMGRSIAQRVSERVVV